MAAIIRRTAKVDRLFVRQETTYIRLDLPFDDGPLDGLFELRPSEANYNAQFALALAAAANRWPLTIRVVGDAGIVKDQIAVVNYLVVDWTAPGDD